jgi:hypothetical protein
MSENNNDLILEPPTLELKFYANEMPEYSKKKLRLLKNKRSPESIARPKQKRNALCLCGSGIKAKRCCLNKPLKAHYPLSDTNTPAI